MKSPPIKPGQIAALLIVLAAVAFAFLFIILPAANRGSQGSLAEKPRNLNEEPGFNESQRLALARVTDSYQYSNYGATNLRLTRTEHTVGCAGCWSFTYVFDVDPSLAPNHLRSVEMSVQVTDGEIRNMTMTEIAQEPGDLAILGRT